TSTGLASSPGLGRTHFGRIRRANTSGAQKRFAEDPSWRMPLRPGGEGSASPPARRRAFLTGEPAAPVFEATPAGPPVAPRLHHRSTSWAIASVDGPDKHQVSERISTVNETHEVIGITAAVARQFQADDRAHAQAIVEGVRRNVSDTQAGERSRRLAL